MGNEPRKKMKGIKKPNYSTKRKWHSEWKRKLARKLVAMMVDQYNISNRGILMNIFKIPIIKEWLSMVHLRKYIFKLYLRIF